MPSTNLVKRDWEKDHVYLIQFPRAGMIPSPSPYAFKVETFLRIADIPYTNINNEFKKMSARGQIPFIELNGRQHADSTIIIDTLIEHFHKTELENLSASDKATARAYFALLEHHLCWVTLYSRGQDFKWLATDGGFGRLLSGIKAFAFKNFIVKSFTSKVRGRAAAQGMGTFSKEEILEQCKKDLDALSVQLGDKPYLFGSSIKTIDATAFAHLAELIYTPQFSPEIKTYFEEKTPNLQAYVNRIKEKYWSDWDETTSTQDMNTTWKME
uniref:Failed axon connections n=1 Tax=Caenorhabditis tropicalis TaxID=1561998 RepID=A0A1I7TFP3_9PELO